MSTASRRKSSTVIKKLTENPGDFSFMQAIRMLERSTVYRVTQAVKKNNNSIGKFVPPQSEFVRFSAKHSFSFPASEINSVAPEIKNSKIQQWKMNISFIGLSGASGVLPYHYTETILQRKKLKDHTIEHFFNLFNHRTTSLFFQATAKYNFPVQYERTRLKSTNKTDHDQQTQALLSLIGLGTGHTTNRLHTKDESLIYYAGLFTQKIRTITGLKQLISNHFSMPVEIKQFTGQWQELIDDVRTRLPGATNEGQNHQLGKNVMLGRYGWFSQGKIKIILGPLTKAQFYKFAPGTSTLKALNEIVSLYLDMEHDYEFVMRIRRSEIPNRIRLDSLKPSIIGWNTWLSSTTQNSLDDTLDIPVASQRYR